MRLRRHPVRAALLVTTLLSTVLLLPSATASALEPLGLGAATDFAIRAGTGVSSVPTSAISGDLGLSPAAGTLYTGLTCDEVTGTIYAVDSTSPLACVVNDPGLMTTVENDARAAFDHASALSGATPVGPDLSGMELIPDLYSFGGAPTNLDGTLTLDAQADPAAVWIFQASSTLITSSDSTIEFTNLPPGITAAEMACNVYWTVGSSATIGSGSTFVGTVLASASIGAFTGATVLGRLLAANAAGGGGAVTLQSNTITAPICTQLPPGTGGGPIPPVVPPVAPPAPPATPVVAPPTLTG